MGEVAVGAVLLLGGLLALFLLGRRPRPDVPPAGWVPDPSTHLARLRFWDGQAWTPWVAPAWEAAPVRGWFSGRFWGPWVAVGLAAVAVTVAGGNLYLSGHNLVVLLASSVAAMGLACLATYRFVARQIGLDEVVSWAPVCAAAVAGAGSALLLAANLNRAVYASFGWQGALSAVGPIEELAKFLVPGLMFLLHRYRNPRAGIGVALGAGFGFAISEVVDYALLMGHGQALDVCGTGAATVTPTTTVAATIVRIFGVESVHWMWTATAVAVGWRLWRLYGPRGALGGLGALLGVMAAHSANDTSALFACGNVGLQVLLLLGHFVLLGLSYVAFKYVLRQNTPPSLVGLVSRGWSPTRLARPRALPPAQPSHVGQGALEHGPQP